MFGGEGEQLNLPKTVLETVETISKKLSPKMAELFSNCYTNTLLTTTEIMEDGSTFIITGDIPAMWLRDSSQQVMHYIDLLQKDQEVRKVIEGLIKKQFMYISIDPYANAFNREPNGQGHQDDITEQNPWIWERKYEVDSLCHPIRLAYLYWKAVGSSDIFDDSFKSVLMSIIKLWKTEQRHDEMSSYRFTRLNCPESDTLANSGAGTRTGYTGMTWSGFRPSDDACEYGYNIPANMFAVTVLGYIEEMAQLIYDDTSLALEAKTLKQEIDEGINKYGVINDPEYGEVYAYEVDGLGHYNLMDDANVPSLLSAPYLNYCDVSDKRYQNTRRYILSQKNPYFYEGEYAKGIGSPHTPKGYIWHIGLIVQFLTSIDSQEKNELLEMIQATDAGTGYMHESFSKDDPSIYTREWFAWANSMFSELVLQSVNNAKESKKV